MAVPTDDENRDTADEAAARQRPITAAVAGSVLAILLGVMALSRTALRLTLHAVESINIGYPTPHPDPAKGGGSAGSTASDMERR